MPDAMPKREEVRERTVVRTWVRGILVHANDNASERGLNTLE